jgi:transposase
LKRRLKNKEHGVPVVYVDPRNTSRMCPAHSAEVVYINGSRVGRCSRGGESWHRDVVARYNLLLRARLGDGGPAPSLRVYARWGPRAVGLDGRP